jgi:hypothetical protein
MMLAQDPTKMYNVAHQGKTQSPAWFQPGQTDQLQELPSRAVGCPDRK